MRRLLVVLVVLAVLGLTACGNSRSSGADATTTTAPFGTAAVSMLPRSPQATLRAVRLGTHDGFVRVVFEFDVAPPGFVVAPASPPFTMDGSGATVQVDGN